MHFLTLLRTGVSIKNVTLSFVQTLLRNSWQDHELNLEISCDFVNDLLKSIGLETSIKPEEINAGGTYNWPLDQIQIYNFHYNVMDFNRVEEFLQEFCSLIQLEHEIFIQDLRDLYDDEDFESPVEYLMQLMAVWCNVFKQLLKLQEMQTSKRFEEPLARINFHLLMGMHELRKIYRLDLHLLDAICNRLYWSAIKGLYYKQTHDMIFSGLLEIFSQDFDLFYASSPATMNFFYEAISVEINNLTPLKLYKTLQQMLKEVESGHKTNILINFLIEPYMLQVYFNTFLAKKYKFTHKNVETIQQEAVKFLQLLQSKLLSLDCFSREFMESILYLTSKSETSTSNLACNLYINMMKRKFSEQIILKHIMDFYVAHVGSIAPLKSYIEALYNNFEFLLNFNNLLELITATDTNDIIRLLSAHILVTVFELKLQKKDTNTQEELQHLLQILPEIFENQNCQKTEGILLKVFILIEPKKLQKSTLDNFIHYSVGVFTHIENNLEYPLLMNLFQVFHRILNFNQEWQHLELLSEHLLHRYDEMLRQLKTKEQQQGKLITKTSLQHYNNLLKRLNIIMKTKYDLLDNNYLMIIRNLSHYFLYQEDIKMFIKQEKSFTDLYVLEIVISCILKLLKIETANNENYTFFPEAQKLFKYLWQKLENLEDLMKLPVVRIKTYFCCFLNLIIFLPLKLETQIYYQLVQILIMLNFKMETMYKKEGNELQQLHPLQSLEYQRLMLRQFVEMHKFQSVEIQSNTVWKLCIYYGMSKYNFQEELKSLLITLANYRFKIYKHIMSVLIYNLYHQSPNLKHMTILSILKQHKHLIDNDIQVESIQLLKLHVVLMVLQILEKALCVQHLKMGQNRLEALRHLNIFIEDLNLNQLQAKELMQQELEKLQKHLINAEERKFFNNFLLDVMPELVC